MIQAAPPISFIFRAKFFAVAHFGPSHPRYIKTMRPQLVPFLVSIPLLLSAQAVRPKDVREAAKAGSSAIPQLTEFLKNSETDVRIEAVKQITEIGTARSLDPLIEATRDNDPEVQIRATDGLVNFYLPGYVRTGI